MFTLHAAELRDVPQIAALSWRYRDLTGAHQTVPELRRMLRDGVHDVLVARDAAGRVVAYGILRARAGRFVTLATASHPGLRIPGAASALNDARYRMVRARGGAVIHGAVSRGNERSLGFRLRDGWRVTGESDDWISMERAV
ncbi:MAG: hypothetical protein M0R28_20470 [Pigmentiphaga sp.]|nr:hypothetical protein [Pigmentiphaga sp.]